MNVMKISPSEKKFLLSQIADVLSKCQSLVSMLSTAECQEEEDSISKVKNLCKKVVAPSLNLMSNNVMHTLAYDCDVSSTTDDDVSSVSSLQSKLSWDLSEDYPVNPVSERFSQTNPCDVTTPEECSFVKKIKCFISKFPNHVYTKEKSTQIKQEVLNENVFYEFQSMWRHSIVGDLFEQNPEADENCTTPPPAPPIVRYKSIDFTKVNVRSLANIPKPERFPVQSCSMDPDFYENPRKDKYGNKDLTLPCHFHNCGGRHGSLYGYQTDAGIVPVPSQPVHGYTWDHTYGSWVLHATDPEESCPAPARTPWRTTRGSTTRRSPSTRRRWPP